MHHSRTLSVVRIFVLVSVCVCTSFAQDLQSPAATRESPKTKLSAQRAAYIRMAIAIGDDYFDGKDTQERVRRHLQVAKAVGARYLRCAFSWNGIEPERGRYRFEFWDMLVAEASRAGITLIPYVAYTPEWAASSEFEFWKQPPSDPKDFANIMRTLALRYRGSIRHWELWNEPDNQEYWTGSPERFAETVIPAAQAVREVAPEVVLILGGMTQGVGDFFKVLVSEYGLDRYVDVLALHAYPESWNEERAETAFGTRVEEMHQIARQSGRKLWLNEMGYADYRYQPNHASLWGTNTYYAYEHTARYAADFLFKSFVMTLASGHVELAGWYRIDDFREDDPRMPKDKVHHHLGLLDVEGGRKPAYFAFRFFNLLFSQPTRPLSAGAARPGSQAVVRMFQHRDGRVIVTGWLRSSNYSEVPLHSGMLNDPRRESVDVPLPCLASQVTTYNVLGKRLATRRRPRRVLRQVQLSGNHVYVAEVTCRSRRAHR